jgi:hypothetical protein
MIKSSERWWGFPLSPQLAAPYLSNMHRDDPGFLKTSGFGKPGRVDFDAIE